MFKYIWVLFILVVCIRALIFSQTARRTLVSRPELQKGYRALLIGQLIVLNIPWVVMGVGCEASNITFFHYFSVRDQNPFVIAWWVCIVLIWILGFYWLFLRHGAEFLVDHRDLWGPWNGRIPSSPWRLKLLYVAAVTGGVFGLGVILGGAIPDLP